MPYRTIAIWATLIVVVYFVTGFLGLRLAAISPSATAVWAPTGIAIASLLLLGYQIAPAIFLGAFVTNLTITGQVLSSLGIAVGNTLEAIVAAYLLFRYARGRRAFDRPPDVFRFVVFGAIFSTAISSTIGVIALLLGGMLGWPLVSPVWFTWWIGDATGALLVAPVIVLWALPADVPWPGEPSPTVLLVVGSAAAAGILIFGGLLPLSYLNYPLAFLTIPVVVFTAFHFGPRDAATAVLVLALTAIWGTLHGHGPFALPRLNDSLLLLQSFMAVTAVMSMGLAAGELDRRRTEAQLRAAEQRLRLAETELRREDQRRAAEAETTRDRNREFMGMVVHDLQSPLTVTWGYAQLLRRALPAGRIEPDTERVLDKIETSIQTMRRLVADLLDATRIGGGRFVISPEEMDLVEVVNQAVEEHGGTGNAHQLVVNAPERLLGCWDAARLRQVLANLISNAIKYSPPGTRVVVEVGQLDDKVRLSVSDQGSGIPADQISRLFEPFARLGRERQATGTGLGLYITKGIVEEHHGRIWVESVVSQGSTFYVELPTQPP